MIVYRRLRNARVASRVSGVANLSSQLSSLVVLLLVIVLPITALLNMLQYQLTHQLDNVHTSGITKVAFSRRGTYVATASLDGRICVWNVNAGNLLYCFCGRSAVLELVWDDEGESFLLCGLADGYVGYLDIDGVLNFSVPTILRWC